MLGVGIAQARRNTGSPIAALGHETLVTQVLGHQLCPQISNAGRVHARLLGSVRKTVPRHGGDDNIEGVGRIAAIGRRVGKTWNDLEHLEEGAGPAVGDHQWQWIGPLALGLYEVDPQPVNVGTEVIEGVKEFFLLPPVKRGAPVLHQFLNVGQVGTVAPVRAGDFVGPAGAGQPFPQVVQYGVGDMYLKGGNVH